VLVSAAPSLPCLAAPNLLELADIRLLISFQFRSEHIRKVYRHAIHLARRENFRHATRDGNGEREGRASEREGVRSCKRVDGVR